MFESRRKYLLGFPYKQVSNNLHFIIVWVLDVAECNFPLSHRIKFHKNIHRFYFIKVSIKKSREAFKPKNLFDPVLFNAFR